MDNYDLNKNYQNSTNFPNSETSRPMGNNSNQFASNAFLDTDPISSSLDPFDNIPQEPPKKKRTGLKVFLIILFSLLALGFIAVCAIILIVVLVLTLKSKVAEPLEVETIPTWDSSYSAVETMAPSDEYDSDWTWEEATEEETEDPWDEEPETYIEYTENATSYSSYEYIDELNRKYDNYFDFYPDENGYIIADSSSRYISSYDLYGMTEHEVCLARNEIYARHGYIFKSEKYNEYFSNFSWYHPTTTEMPDLQNLNSYEYENVQTIIAYESSRGW